MDSLEKALHSAHDTVKISIFAEICWMNRNIDLQKSIKAGDSAIILAKKFNSKNQLAKIYNYLGIVYRNLGNYPQALDFFIQSLKTAEEINNSDELAYAYNNIADIYNRQADYRKAIEYVQKSENAFSKSNNIKGKAYCFNMYGLIYENLNKYDSALLFHNKALDLRKNLNEKNLIPASLLRVGVCLREKGMYDEALVKFMEAINLFGKLNDKQGKANALNATARCYLKKNDIKLAENYALLNYELLQKSELNNSFVECALTLSEIYAAKKEFGKAYDFLNAFNKLNDSLYNKTKNTQIANIHIAYQFEKEEATLKLLRKENELQSTIKNSFIIGFGFVLIFVVILIYSYVQKNKAYKMLDEKNNEITQKSNQIQVAVKEIEKKNKDITANITYAKRIQKAILTPDPYINEVFVEHFIFNKPKLIISGDFFWLKRNDKYFFAAVADCTGHGVPGAFMSMLGVALLNEIIKKEIDLHADEILNELREQIKISLQQSGRDSETKDGMDIALCVINIENYKMEFAGANNPLYLIRKSPFELNTEQNNSDFLIEYKADKMPIGIHAKLEKPFTRQSVSLKKGDSLYLFSDGYCDQFGGAFGRKFLSKNFKDLLISIQNNPFELQQNILEQTISDWRGQQFEQIDDILILGLKI